MKLFNKIAIVGLGLIGGSMGLVIKKKRLAKEVVGVSRHRQTILLAKKMQAIDSGSQNLKIIKGADLVILATPVSTIFSLAVAISKIIRPDCIVSDVGSTKQEIASKLGRVFTRYVGSHPLAGSEKCSIKNANSRLFRDSLCILTPSMNTDAQALDKMRRLWFELGARVTFLPASTHDKILSFVSHLPHAIAFSLIGIVPKRYLRFASTGLKDTTRIAASDSRLWEDIFLSNKKNIIKAIDLFRGNLLRIKKAINKKDRKALSKFLKEAKRKRDSL
jgi:prephenate dehydrogenase